MRYELAISVINTLKQQDESLATAKEKIEKARQAELKSVHRDADFIYTGVLKVSHVYTKKTGRKRYLLQGPDGKILCYAVPTTEEVAGQFEAPEYNSSPKINLSFNRKIPIIKLTIGIRLQP